MAGWTERHAVILRLFTVSIAVLQNPSLSCKVRPKGKPSVCYMQITQCLGIRVVEQTNICLSNTSAWSRLVY